MNIDFNYKRYFALQSFNDIRENFYEDLVEAIRDKETIKVFLLSTQEHYEKNDQKGLANLYGEMLENVGEGGWKISNMMKGIVPDSDMLILTANDNVTSEADQISGFMYLAATIRKMRELKSTVKMALITPMLVFPVLIFFILMIAYLFVPENEKILSHEHWNSNEQILYWISYAVLNYGILIAGGGIFLVLGYIKTFANWTGETRSKMEAIPVLGTPYLIYRNFQAANFLTALASLMKSRLDLVSGLGKLQENATPWMRWHISETLNHLHEFPNDSSGAFNTGLLSPELHMRLTSYERRSNFNDGLLRMGTDGMSHVTKEVKSSSMKLNIASLVVTVLSIVALYGTNLSITDTINKHLKVEQLETK